MSNIETIAETIVWEAERRLSERNEPYENLVREIYTVNMEIGRKLSSHLKTLNLIMKARAS